MQIDAREAGPKMAAVATEHVDIAGETDITISCEAEFKEYPYSKAVDIWSLVTLKAPCHVSEVERAPIDIVAVIDKSGSMSGSKLELVKTTTEFVLGQLKDDDRLSIVTYDTHVNVDFKLMKMNKENKASCLAKIQSIQSGSSTNLSGGLLTGLQQIAVQSEGRNEVATVLLFTDGLANHGITNVQGIIAAMKNPKMYGSGAPSRPAQVPKHQTWLGRVFGSKSAPEEHSESANPKTEEKEVAIPATVYTFGFGADHDPDLLKAISDAANGMYYFIENEDKIAESFGHCLGGLLSTVGQGIQLSLVTEEGVKINQVHVNRPHDLSADSKSLKVDMGDLQSEEERDVVIQLGVDAVPIPRETTPQPLFLAEVNYFNVISEKIASSQTSLSVFRTNISENKADEGSLAVNKQRDRIETTNVIKRATEMADNDDLESARNLLFDQIRTNKSKAYADDEYIGALSSDLANCAEMVQSKSVWMKKGKKAQLNVIQMHEQQRSSEATSNAYKSRSKAAMGAKFKAASKGP